MSAIALNSCQVGSKPEIADLILQNANIFTVNDNQPTAQAIAIKGDRILAVGSDTEIAAFAGGETEIEDLNGQFVMPGFIEGHGHFQGVGRMAMNLNFLRAESWDDIVAEVAKAAAPAAPGEWIIGRG
ncbi:MAG: amidohydrolase family protein, partial [Saprospiraceae bacterium]|nr:amidohydrolase family protein [Saprospiraceae bacterium]